MRWRPGLTVGGYAAERTGRRERGEDDGRKCQLLRSAASRFGRKSRIISTTRSRRNCGKDGIALQRMRALSGGFCRYPRRREVSRRRSDISAPGRVQQATLQKALCAVGLSLRRRDVLRHEGIGYICVVEIHPKFPFPCGVFSPDIYIATAAMNGLSAALRRQCEIVPPIAMGGIGLRADFD